MRDTLARVMSGFLLVPWVGAMMFLWKYTYLHILLNGSISWPLAGEGVVCCRS